MSQFLTSDYLIAFLFSVIRMSTPIIFCALGALIASHAGAINMALEGIMLTASLLAVMFSAWLQNCWAGLLGAVLGGLLMSLLFAWLHLYKDSDLIITGLALNTMASGGTVYLLYLVCGDKGTSRLLPSINLPNVELPLIRHIPVLGPVLSGHNILTYLALVAVFLCWVLVFRSRLGLRIRAVGFNPNAAASVGISVRRVKFEALLLSGLFASLGGAFMSMGYLSYFARDMMAGRRHAGRRPLPFYPAGLSGLRHSQRRLHHPGHHEPQGRLGGHDTLSCYRHRAGHRFGPQAGQGPQIAG